jgi:hypothetical protein
MKSFNTFMTTKKNLTRNFAKNSLLILSFFFLSGLINTLFAQEAIIRVKGNTTICEGESTTLEVIIGASSPPYTVVYTNGVSNFTATNYDSDADPESPSYGGDAITVSPIVTTQYSLVSVHDQWNNSLPISSETATVTVNPLPINIVVTIATAPVCYGVDFQISATSTYGNSYELWNSANTSKIADLPYTTSITQNTNYTVRAISEHGCTTSEPFDVNLENIPPTISCPGNQTLNPNPATGCSASLPDFRSLVTVSDNCTASGSVALSQSPAPGTSISGHNTQQTVTITATDQAGNQNSCNFTVTLTDNILPQITCVGNQTVPASSTCTYTHSGTGWNPVTGVNATDNCTVSSVAFSANNGASPASGVSLNGVEFQPGTTNVTWTVTDGAGNTAQCNFNVSIEDIQKPLVTCPGNQTVNTASGVCTYSHNGTGWNVTASDNCTVASVVYSLSGATTGIVNTTLDGAVFNKGETTVNVTVSDGAAIPNTETCSFTVSVTDNQDPTVSCPSNISVNNNESSCSASVTIPEINFGDNCPGAVLSWSTTGVTTINGSGQPGVQTFNVGVTTVNLLVTDAANRTNACSFNVTVTDNQLPTITCPENIAVSNDANQCYATVNVPAVVFGDNCTGSSVSWSTSGVTVINGSEQIGSRQFNVGETTVTVIVTDASLNIAQCSFTVTVNDVQDPSIICPGNITANNDVNQCYGTVTIPEIVFSDNCPGSTLSWSTTGATILSGTDQPGSKQFYVGVTTVNLLITDAASRTASCSFTIMITDNQKPVVNNCPNNLLRSPGSGVCTATVFWTEPTASDNCTPSGSLVRARSHAPGSVFNAGVTTVTYTFQDAAGNISDVCSFTVTVTDDQKPVISNCPSDITANVDAGQCYATVSWTEPTATDNCTASGAITWTKSHTPGDEFAVGTHPVTYTARDANGNVSNECTFFVNVTDNESPTAICKPASINLNASGNATLTVADVNDGSWDNCTAQGSLVLTLSKTSFNCTNRGENNVTLTVRDAAGNQSTCVAEVTVADNILPTLTGKATTNTSNINTDASGCYYEVKGSEFDPTPADNCSVASMSYVVTGATTLTGTGSLSGKQLNQGANVITWTAQDASGNVSDPLSFTKTVLDNQAPTLTLPGNQTRNTTSGCNYIVLGAEFDPVVGDNCSGSSITVEYKINTGDWAVGTTIEGLLLARGINTIRWRASDGANSREVLMRVTVEDNVAPVIMPIDNMVLGVSGGCTALAAWTVPVVTDNCDASPDLEKIAGPNSGQSLAIGVYTVRYRATDNDNNSSEMAFTITVRDIAPPSITCAPGSTELFPFERVAGAGVCFYTVLANEFNPTSVTDDCNFTVTNSFDNTNTLAGKQLPTGEYPVVWTARDLSGNTSTCTIYVKITDNQVPAFTPYASAVVRTSDPGQCYHTIPSVDFDPKNMNDNCAIANATFVITKNGEQTHTGTNTLSNVKLVADKVYPYMITWTVTDVNGNSTVATPFSFQVNDNQGPAMVCLGNTTANPLEGQCSYIVSNGEFDPVNVADNCDVLGSLIFSYTINGGVPVVSNTMNGVALPTGNHAIVWTIKDTWNNSTSCSFNISVKSGEFPSISTINNQTRPAPGGSCTYTVVGDEFDPTASVTCGSFTLTHNQGGATPESLAGYTFTVGKHEIVWTAKDAGGNATNMQFQLTVEDITAPDYTLAATASRDAESTSCYYSVVGNEFDPQSITDNCTTDNYFVSNNFNGYRSLAYAQLPVGATPVEWTVRDFHGNETKKTITITVTDNTDPVINCPGIDYARVVDSGQSYYTVGTNEFRPLENDNCGVVTYEHNYGLQADKTTLNGVQLPEGEHNITWTALDARGNDATCEVTIHVVSSLHPSINCVGDQAKSADEDNCYYIVSGTEFNATSTSSIATLTHNYVHANVSSNTTLADAEFPVGTTIITWTATQTVAGTVYTSTCWFYVTVSDNQNPNITAPANIETTAACYATGVNLGTPIVSDNCTASPTVWNNASENYPYGFRVGQTSTVTWYARDAAWNISSTTQTVTVTDNVPPTISCPGSICRQVDNGQTYYTVNGHEFNPYHYSDCSGIKSITNDFNGSNTLAGAQIPTTVTSIIWTVTDNADNVNTCTINLDIQDDDPPSVTCMGNQTRNTDPDVCYYTAGNEFDVTASSGSLTHNIGFAPNSNTLNGAQFPPGTYTITWTATDGGDVNSCCTFTLTVTDNEQPDVSSWPADVARNVETGSCTATISSEDIGSPVVTDNCDDNDISVWRSPSGNTFGLGVTTITWTVSDGRGNYRYHTQTVTVTDNIDPEITCPASTYYREFNNQSVNYYTVSGNEFRPAVTDNCGVASYINNRNSSTTLNRVNLTIGEHAIKWTATDNSGRTDECTVNITVVDSFDPIISALSGNINFNTPTVGCDYTVSGTSLDPTWQNLSVIAGRTLTHNIQTVNAGIIPYAPSSSTLEGAKFTKGTTLVTWTAKQTIDGTEYTTARSYNVVIIDNIAPVMDLPFLDVTLNVEPGKCFFDQELTPPTATDNCTEAEDIVVTNDAHMYRPFLVGETNVRWTMTDESGNQTVHIQKVTVVDNEGPVISNCPTENITATASGSLCQVNVTWPQLIAVDACSGVKSFTSTHSSGSAFNVGTTVVTYTAIDNKNNPSTCTFNVVVGDTDPEIDCVEDQSRNTNPDACSYKVLGNEFDPVSITDNCAVASVTWSFYDKAAQEIRTGANTLSGQVIPRGFGVGETGEVPITWTVTDTKGNETPCTFMLTINDNEGPQIIVPGNATRYTDSYVSTYTIQGTEFDYVEVSDNCGIVVKLVNNLAIPSFGGQVLNLGLNTITWYAEDDKENKSEMSFNITVLDNLSPRVKTIQTGTTVNASSSSCDAVVSYIAPVFEDNVTATNDLTVTVSPSWATPGATFPIGTTAVTYMVVDEAGNSFAHTFNITVNDVTLPTITCVTGSPFTKEADLDKDYYAVQGTEFNPGAYSDNCGASISNNFNNLPTLEGARLLIGENTIVWTVTDNSSNTATCTIVVNVEDKQDPYPPTCPEATISRISTPGDCGYKVFGAEYDPYNIKDNHGISKVTYSIDGGAEVGADKTTTLGGVVIPVGTNVEVLWRIFDLSNNVLSTCTSVFTVVDIEEPLVQTVTDQTRSTNTGVNTYTIKTGDNWNAVVTDNCGVAKLRYRIDGGGWVGTDASTSIVGVQLAVGTHTIEWEGTDVNGLTTTGSYVVTIQDNEAPTVACNNITVVLDATGNYTLTAGNIAAIGSGSTDPGGIASMSVSPEVFSCSNVGANTVTLTVFDIYGNQASCPATVTVQDNTAPIALCKDVSVNLDALGNATVTALSINNTSTDACGIASYQISKDDVTYNNSLFFNCTEVTAHTVYLKVTDVNGNSNTCEAEVTVNDITPPAAVCNPLTVYLDATGNYTLTAGDIDAISLGSADNCALSKTVTPNTFTCVNVGANTVTLRVTDPQGNFEECTTTVTVVDNTLPVAICQNITVQLDATGNVSITPAQINNGSNDACGIKSLELDITDFNCSNIGSNPLTNTVTLTVTDNNDNIKTCTALVTVEDLIAPVVTCRVSGEQLVETHNGVCTYTHSGTTFDADVNDACITIASLSYALSGATVVANNPANTSLDGVVFNKGITTVTWTAVDASNNSSTCSFTVNVQDNEDPVAICQNVTIQLDATGNTSVTALAVNNNSTDNCGIQSYSLSKTDFVCSDLGEKTVTLTVTDLSGNTNTCEATITVQDLIDPVAVCSPITISLNSSGNHTLAAGDIATLSAGSSDNCAIVSRVVSPNTFDCTDIGTPVNVTLTVTDADGNSDDCTTTVTVQDIIAPNALCKNATIQLGAAGSATLNNTDINNNSTDACGIATVQISKDDVTYANSLTYACGEAGTHTVYLKVTDVNGNSSVCSSATVNVQDKIDPTFTSCPGNQTPAGGTDPGVCTYTHTDNSWNPAATDNCAVSTLTYTVSAPSTLTAPNTTLNGQVFAKGVTTVTWTATDASGNTETCVFTVTVNDDENPVANCQAFTANIERDGDIEIIPANIDNTSTDNCGIVTYEISKNNTDFFSSLTYNCSEIGTPTIYLRVTDAANLTHVCSSTLTVQDIQAPTLDDLTDREMVTNNGVCTYTHSDNTWNPTDNCDASPTIYYGLSGATNLASDPENFSLNGQVFNQGTTTVTWTVADHATVQNTGTVTFDVVVTDNQDPTVLCPSNITKTISSVGVYQIAVNAADGLTAPTYGDNCAVTSLEWSITGAGNATGTSTGSVSNPTNGVSNPLNGYEFLVGTSTVTYTVYDAEGNSEDCSFTITINSDPSDITISATEITTYENQALGAATFTVKLPAAPTGNVCIDVTSSDVSEGLINIENVRGTTSTTKTICFNASNWNTPKTIYVFGINDNIDDDDQTYSVNLSINTGSTDAGSGYYFATPGSVSATNMDDDAAGITVSSISGPTTEAGGTATFTMRLNSQPVNDVTFTLLSSDLTEGDVTNPAGKTVTFTSANWNTNQTITVTGINDDIDDGNVAYQINISNASSADPKYNGLFATNVNVTNNDNDTAGFTVSAISNTTSENATTATFTVRLNSKPATDAENYIVVVDVVSNDAGEGTVDKASLTFDHTNWNINQTVTVTGVNDDLVDGSISYSVILTVDGTSTTDAIYDLLNPADVSVTNTDNDAVTLAINSPEVLEGDAGTTALVFTVTQTGFPVVGGYSVSYYTSNGTAKSPTDFAGGGSNVSFSEGESFDGATKTITININGDNMVEPNETFTVVLNTISGLTGTGKSVTIPVAGKTGTGTILNDDSSSLSIDDVAISEGNSGTKTLTFTVTLTNAVELGVKVDYVTADGTSTDADNDYDSKTGTLTFAGTAGETETIGITINGDTKVELNELFTVVLSNVSQGNEVVDANITISDDTGTGTITNDDAAVLSVTGTTVTETLGGHNGQLHHNPEPCGTGRVYH